MYTFLRFLQINPARTNCPMECDSAVSALNSRGIRAQPMTWKRKRDRNCLAIIKEYGIDRVADPVLFVLRVQECFSHAVNSSREMVPLSHSAFFSLACLLQS